MHWRTVLALKTVEPETQRSERFPRWPNLGRLLFRHVLFIFKLYRLNSNMSRGSKRIGLFIL